MSRYLENVVSKLFADDTTLIVADEDVNKLESKLIKCLEAFDEWCKHNRLYINWDKTFIMYITNRRAILPNELRISNNRTVKVVDKFKLLGVTIDNKLKFDSFVQVWLLPSFFLLNLVLLAPFRLAPSIRTL